MAAPGQGTLGCAVAVMVIGWIVVLLLIKALE
jgi:hypothetical protein